jgi:hypothetical protein
MKLKKLYTEATSDAAKMAEDIGKILKKEFPKSYVSVEFDTHFVPDITVRIMLGKDRSEWANGIWQNDRLGHTSIITGFDDDGNFTGDKVDVRLVSGGHWTIDEAPQHMAFGRLKIGWRNFKAKPDQVAKKYAEFAKKTKKIALDNLDKFKPEIQDMLKKKLK